MASVGIFVMTIVRHLQLVCAGMGVFTMYFMWLRVRAFSRRDVSQAEASRAIGSKQRVRLAQAHLSKA